MLTGLSSAYPSARPSVTHSLTQPSTCSHTHRSKNDLSKQLTELKNELPNLQVQRPAGG
ncbi:hypothetical protein EVJ58_g10749 [Rhodofomes roseus]|uniref:Uncharacterized protein n=1 Tax=Rhodofomes roseus TaxID=34475 RepID=A0A4Y9XLY2_9APHY|nr:hypothetical protein EVJ58_g10749 [Rhodofomes roseus]